MKRNNTVLTLAALLLLICAQLAHASNNFRVDIREVEGIVHRVVPDVTVDSVSMSPVPGLYEVVINSTDSSKGVLYLSVDKRHLIAGSIIDTKEGMNLTEARFMDVSRIDLSSIPLEDALVLGNSGAKNRVIVLDDPD